MKALVTGGAGFIGSHVMDALISRGWEVAAVDDLSTGKFENLNAAATFYKMDIRDRSLAQVFERESPEVVFHLAAQASVSASVADPAEDASVNLLGSINLLENCVRYQVGKMIYSSSAAVYGNPEYLPVDERHPVEPLSPYGLSKLTVEKYLAVYNKLHRLEYTVLRYANVYGPRQIPAAEAGVVAVFAGALQSGRSVTIHGDGLQTRDLIFVEDVAAANLQAIERGNGAVVNIGTGCQTSIIELYRLMRKVFGGGPEAVHGPVREGDIRQSCLDHQLASSLLGWQPMILLEEGLRRTLKV